MRSWIVLLEIIFASDKLRTDLNDSRSFQKQYGERGAKRLRQRLDDLRAASTLEVMRALPGRCHELTGNRSGQLALDIEGRYRLIFEPADEPLPQKNDGGLDWKNVTIVRILGVEDYHDHHG
jgi:plasmid maintenance system killer protein